MPNEPQPYERTPRPVVSVNRCCLDVELVANAANAGDSESRKLVQLIALRADELRAAARAERIERERHPDLFLTRRSRYELPGADE